MVELNNEWRKLQLDEQEEVRRLLAELSDLVADEAPHIRQTVEALALLDLIFARARYADDLRASEPELVELKADEGKGRKRREGRRGSERSDARVPRLRQHVTLSLRSPCIVSAHPGSTIDLRKARHPLLNPETVVPIDVYLDDDYFVILVTGPNTGGKTVTLKTVGLLALMAQAGMHIPAGDGSRLSCFEAIFADIGDEQSIEQSLSTFSSHMTNIIAILDEADERSLVLLDELGAGTDPEEGSALARALLDHLVRRASPPWRPRITRDLKVYAHSTPGVRNASVEFDVETLAPTYELSIGLPGRSNALAIATRLGLDRADHQRGRGAGAAGGAGGRQPLAGHQGPRASGWKRSAARPRAARRQAEAHEKELRYRLAQHRGDAARGAERGARPGPGRAGRAGRRDRPHAPPAGRLRRRRPRQRRPAPTSRCWPRRSRCWPQRRKAAEPAAAVDRSPG